MTCIESGRRVRGAIAALFSLALAAALARLAIGPLPLRPGMAGGAPHPMATWPWPKAVMEQLRPGVTHWLDRSAADGTVLDLLEFDFAANPRLRFEIYDQDEDDPKPFDNRVDFFPRGVGAVVRHLNEHGRGKVIAAWNGLFFSTDGGVGRHVAPVVLDGKVYHNVGNHRWTFGVAYRDGRPEFKALHLPDRETLAREFTFAAGGAQCLVREGRPLKVQPFPRPGDPPLKRPVPSTPEEAGHIPTIDHIRTSRVSMGWSRDSRRFYLLAVDEPDSETASIQALRTGAPLAGGFLLADLQRFWLAMGVWGAVNIDGGDVMQMTYLRPDGRYEMAPPRWATTAGRLVFGPDFAGAPKGGTLMYPFVREAPAAARP